MERRIGVDPSTFLYVLRVYKGRGYTLGEVAAHAREFELGMDAFLDRVEEEREVSE